MYAPVVTYFGARNSGAGSAHEAICADPYFVPSCPRKKARKQANDKIDKEYKRNIDGKARKQRDHD